MATDEGSGGAVAGTLRTVDGGRFYIETLGCPKNQVDSDKLVGTLLADGLARGRRRRRRRPRRGQHVRLHRGGPPGVDRHDPRAGRRERRDGARLVVTGCMAERYGDELADGAARGRRGRRVRRPGHARPRRPGSPSPAVPGFDLLNLPRPAPTAPWAYVKVAEGCDRACGFCAIPSFRGPQRIAHGRPRSSPRSTRSQVARRSCSSPRTSPPSGATRAGRASHRAAGRAVAARVDRVRLLYLYPSDLTDALIDAICATGVPYFDLSLQHVSRAAAAAHAALGRRRRGSSSRIDAIRAASPTPRSARTSSSATRARPRPTTTQLLALRRGGAARLVRLLRLLRGGGHLRRRPRRRGRRRRWWPSASPS